MTQPVDLSASGPSETVLPDEPEEARAALTAALELQADERRDQVSAVVARFPTFLEGWARVGDLGRDPVERYAAYRVGYHRGLDRLRQSGWRGSGYVRWEHPSNRGFLRSLHGLATTAGAIGETDEQQRCEQFLRQLDPSWPPPELA